MIFFTRVLLLTFITITCGIASYANAQNSSLTHSEFHVFGHSLFTYAGGDDAPHTVYTNTGNWLGLLASASGNTSIGSYTWGQIANHNSQDWSAVNGVVVNGSYDLGNTSEYDYGSYFEEKSFTHFYLMPSNFDEIDMGRPPYDNSVATTQSGLERLIDNIDNYYPSSEKILYVHWPDAGFYLDNNIEERFDALNDRSRFSGYNNDTITDYLAWHVNLQDAINANGRTIKTIPVGPVIAWLFENEPYLQSLNFTDVYGDSAPHGRENIYLLAALVVYQATYQTLPALANFTIPNDASQVRPEIANNLSSIITAIQARLNFHHANGVRVWSDDIGNRAPVASAYATQTLQNESVSIDVSTLIDNATDPDGDALSLQSTINPVNGTVEQLDNEIVFHPALGFIGDASFTYVVSDGVLSDSGIVTITVSNDSAPNMLPEIANSIFDRTARAEETFTYTIPAYTFTDADGDLLTLSLVSPIETTFGFDQATATFTSLVNNANTTRTIAIAANDDKGGSVTDTFELVVIGSNQTAYNLDPNTLSNTVVNTTIYNLDSSVLQSSETATSLTFNDPDNKVIYLDGHLSGTATGIESYDVFTSNQTLGAVSSGSSQSDGWIEFALTDSSADSTFGFDSDAASGFSRPHQFVIEGDHVAIYENGSWVDVSLPPYVVGDVYRLTRVGSTVSYSRNGDVYYTSTQTTNQLLRLGGSFYGQDRSLDSVAASFAQEGEGNSEPYYVVQPGDTWNSIATLLYGTADVADELQALLGTVELVGGTLLTGFPDTISNNVTVTVPVYYAVPANTTWASLAQTLYGSEAIASQLQAAIESSYSIVADEQINGVDLPPYFIVNNSIPDTDGDGYTDDVDAFPNDPNEWLDSDNDGVGDNSDAFPNDSTETLDTDGDGVGDNSDAFPNDSTETRDTDGDGIGDNADPTPFGEMNGYLQFDGQGYVTLPEWSATGDFRIAFSFTYQTGVQVTLGSASNTQNFVGAMVNGLIRARVAGLTLDVEPVLSVGDRVDVVLTRTGNSVSWTANGVTVTGETAAVFSLNNISGYDSDRRFSYTGQLLSNIEMDNGSELRTYDVDQREGTSALPDTVSGQHGTLMNFTDTGGFIAIVGESPEVLGIGGNLSELAQWDAAWPFADLMKASYAWREVSGTGAYAIDIHDRITQLDGDRVLGKYLASDVQDPTLPAAGEYTVRKTGTGEYNIAGTGWTSAETSTFTIAQGEFLDIQVRSGTIDSLLVARTSDLATIDTGNPWRPEFLSYITDLNPSSLRYLNWFVTNNNLNENWSDRTIVDALSYSGTRERSSGMGSYSGSRQLTIPVEHMIDLSNRLESNMWITVPTRFNDTSITHLAELLRDNLDPNLTIKVEYSNETWNFSPAFFSQMLWAATHNIPRHTLSGTAGSNRVTFTGYTPTEGETIRVIHHNDAERRVEFANPFFENSEITVTNVSGNSGDLSSALPAGTEIMYFYRTSEAGTISGDAIDASSGGIENIDYGTAQRSLEIWDIFDTVFSANNSRIKKVIATQAGWLERTTNRIGVNGTNGVHDIVSPGGYFGIDYRYTAGDTVADVISFLRGSGISDTGPVADSIAAVQDIIDLDVDPLYSVSSIEIYEGGGHMLPVDNTGTYDADADILLKEVNRSADFGQLLLEVLQHYAALPIVDEFNVYRIDPSVWGGFGYWGLTESYSDVTGKYTQLELLNGSVLRNPPSEGYRYYRFVPQLLRGAEANSIELAEVSFFANGERLLNATVTNPGGDNPPAEIPAYANDGDINTKWLDFNQSALVFDFGEITDIDRYSITTAGSPFAVRQPIRWLLEASNDNETWIVVNNQNSADYAFDLGFHVESPRIALPNYWDGASTVAHGFRGSDYNSEISNANVRIDSLRDSFSWIGEQISGLSPNTQYDVVVSNLSYQGQWRLVENEDYDNATAVVLDGSYPMMSDALGRILLQNTQGSVGDFFQADLYIVEPGQPIEPELFSLTVNGGTASTEGPYLSGTEVTITADAAPAGQVFDQWVGSGSLYVADANASSTVLTIPEENVSITASYKDSVVSTEGYRYYRFVPQLLRGAEANSIELAEVSFFANGERLLNATVTNPGGDNPPAEIPAYANDGDINTKWLDFNQSALVFDFGGITDIDRYSITTAGGPFAVRQPIRWLLEASNDNETWIVVNNQNSADYAFDLGFHVESPRIALPNYWDGASTVAHGFRGSDYNAEISNATVRIDSLRDGFSWIGEQISGLSPNTQYDVVVSNLSYQGQWRLVENEDYDNATAVVLDGSYPMMSDALGRILLQNTQGSAGDFFQADLYIVEPGQPIEPELFSLTVNGGTASTEGPYLSGTEVTITADTAPEGQAFDQWVGDITGISDIRASSTIFTVGLADATVSARYRNVSPPPINDPYPNLPKFEVSSSSELTQALANSTDGGEITLLPGRYSCLTLANRSHTVSAPLLLKGQAGQGSQVIFDGGIELPQCSQGIQVDNSRYITIDNITVEAGLEGIAVENSQNIIINGVKVSLTRQAGIHVLKNSHDIDILNSTIFNTGTENPQWGECIYVGTGDYSGFPDATSRVWIENNEVYNCGFAEGINIKPEVFNATLRNNYIYNIQPGHPDYTQFNLAAITIESGRGSNPDNNYLPNTPREVWVEHNCVKDVSKSVPSDVGPVSSGRRSFGHALMVGGTEVYVRDNVISNFEESGIYVNGFGNLGQTVYLQGNRIESLITGSTPEAINSQVSIERTTPGANPNRPQGWLLTISDRYFDAQGASDHLIAMEAESFHQRNKGIPCNHWQPTMNGDASNDEYLTVSGEGRLYNADNLEQSPRLDYNVNFAQTGTYYIWVLGNAASGVDDSLHIGLNGEVSNSGERASGFLPYGSNQWSQINMDGEVITIDVTQVGVQTLNVWAREDGFLFDKIILTQDASYDPRDVGNFGPQESIQLAPSLDSGPFEVTIINGNADQSGSYTEGTVISLTADVAPEGQVFERWLGSDASRFTDITAPTTDYTVGFADTVLTAQYIDEPTVGGILREWWLNQSGNSLDPSIFDTAPDGQVLIRNMSVPNRWGDNFAARISGVFYPPVSGNYVFWVSGDDNVELWLSTDDSPANKQLIANVPGFSNRFQWDKYAEQQSISLNLTAGSGYYIEVLHKEGGFNDHADVAWQLPNSSERAVLSGDYFESAPVVPLFDLTITNGSASEAGPYPEGTVVTIAGGPVPANQIFDQWVGDTDGVSDVTEANTSFVVGQSDASLTAIYRDITPAATTINIDFGRSETAAPGWNVQPHTLNQALTLIDAEGETTSIDIVIVDGFSGVNTLGATGVESYPDSVSEDNLYGGRSSNPTAGFQLRGLIPSELYRFTFFASRDGVSDNRQVEYQLIGTQTESVYLDAANNASASVNIDVVPDSNGVVTVNLRAGPDNSSSDLFYYISALSIETDANNEPPLVPVTISITPYTDGETVNLVVGDTFTAPTLSATGNEVSITSSGTVDTNTEGTYVLTYTATDADGNTVTATLNVVVSAAIESTDDVSLYTFGHSLWRHYAGDNNPVANQRTTVDYWMAELADETGNNYQANGRLPLTADFPDLLEEPPTNQFPPLGDVQDLDGNVQANKIVVMPYNFLWNRGSDADNQEIDFGPAYIQENMQRLNNGIQWLTTNRPDSDIILYEHWPELSLDDYAGGGTYPLSPADWEVMKSKTLNHYHNWYLNLYDYLNAQHPSANIKMVPVGPILVDMMRNENLAVSEMSYSELYYDLDPHGTPTLYFLVSLIMHEFLYRESAPISFAPGSRVHGEIDSRVLNDMPAITAYIKQRLNEYNASGVEVY